MYISYAWNEAYMVVVFFFRNMYNSYCRYYGYCFMFIITQGQYLHDRVDNEEPY
jgi:hypothetical protein